LCKVVKRWWADFFPPIVIGSQFLEPDGWFPNHVPNPEDPAAMRAGAAAVKRSGADLGIVVDTDVDRRCVAYLFLSPLPPFATPVVITTVLLFLLTEVRSAPGSLAPGYAGDPSGA
jgi:phosphomannomutase